MTQEEWTRTVRWRIRVVLIALLYAFGNFSLWYSIHRGDFDVRHDPVTFFGVVGIVAGIFDGLGLLACSLFFFEEGGWLEQILDGIYEKRQKQERQAAKIREIMSRDYSNQEWAKDWLIQEVKEPPRGEWRRD